MRVFDVIPNFANEKMDGYYLRAWYLRAASRVVKLLKTKNLKKLENIKKVSKLHRMIAQCLVSHSK